jgi:hypothetical protein
MQGTGGVVVYDENVPADGQRYSPTYNGEDRITIDRPDILGGMLKLGQDGNPITDYYIPRYYMAESGCAFCGQTNLVR